jgi:hypothetical protein
MDKPAQNADVPTDLYFGPKSPGQGKNWLATTPDKGFFVVFRLYGPSRRFTTRQGSCGILRESAHRTAPAPGLPWSNLRRQALTKGFRGAPA